jgi:transcription elongation factor Elf1
MFAGTTIVSDSEGTHMSQVYFAPSPRQFVERPACPKCGAATLLTRVGPDEPGFGIHTFECSNCQNSVNVRIKFK